MKRVEHLARQNNTHRPVNVASVPQLSPFRYPGGKTWCVPLFRSWIKSLPNRPELLVEPFAGGAIIGLTAAFENLANKVLLVELDEQVATVWQTLLGGQAQWLQQRILGFVPSPQSIKEELAKPPVSARELAFQTILRNRTQHGGILAGGSGLMKTGENGKGVLSRWYPQTLAKRMASIALTAQRIDFICGDAFAAIEKYIDEANTVFFIDPPYTAGGKNAGKRLYTHYQIDHERLFSLCAKLKGEFIMTYDNASEVRNLALRFGFDYREVVMKNTHNAELEELLIGRDFSWFDQIDNRQNQKLPLSFPNPQEIYLDSQASPAPCP